MIRCSDFCFVLQVVTRDIKDGAYITTPVLYRIRIIAAVVVLFGA